MEGYDEPYRREINRGDEISASAARFRPARDLGEVEDYHQRVMSWIGAILSAHTSTPEGWTEEAFEKLDKEMEAMPPKSRRALNRLYLQADVLAWVRNMTLDDLVEETRRRVEATGVDMYDLEDKWRGDDDGASSEA
jgi:hypothetical protein